MKNLKILAALGLLSAAGAAQAGVSSTWTLTNDYDFRGFSQSAKDPAIQGSLDYAHDSGWYLGAWASNIDFDVPDGVGLDDPEIEVDVYTGFTGGDAETGIGWDAGLVYYAYPEESDFDYMEIYASAAHKWFKGKLWWSNDFGGDTTSGNTDAFYLEGNATFPLPQNFSILLHAGYSFGDYWDDSDEVLDYSAGVGYSFGNFNFALKYVNQDTDIDIEDDAFNNEGRVVFTVATTFPWSNE